MALLHKSTFVFYYKNCKQLPSISFKLTMTVISSMVYSLCDILALQ